MHLGNGKQDHEHFASPALRGLRDDVDTYTRQVSETLWWMRYEMSFG